MLIRKRFGVIVAVLLAPWLGGTQQGIAAVEYQVVQVTTLGFPSGSAAFDSSGNLWVTDNLNGGVKEINPSSGAVLRTIGGGFLGQSQGLGFDSEGNVWVGDSDNSRFVKFRPNGTIIFEVDFPNNPVLGVPPQLAVDHEGNMWAFQRDNVWGDLYLHEFDRDTGNSSQSHPEITALPMYGGGIAIDCFGNFWVGETDGLRKYDSHFNPLPLVDGLGPEHNPLSIAVNATGTRVYVVENFNSKVDVLDGDGKFLGSFGTSGTGPGQFVWPAGVTVDSDANVWVSEHPGSRIQEFSAIPEPSTLLVWSGLGTVGAVMAWRRRRQAA